MCSLSAVYLSEVTKSLGRQESLFRSPTNTQAAHSLRQMVGERGFEPRTPWCRTDNRCTKLLFRLGFFCVVYRLFVWHSGANGPKLDPCREVLNLPGKISGSEPRCASGQDGIPAVHWFDPGKSR